MPIKALKIIRNLNHMLKPILVLIRSWDVTWHASSSHVHQRKSYPHMHPLITVSYGRIISLWCTQLRLSPRVCCHPIFGLSTDIHLFGSISQCEPDIHLFVSMSWCEPDIYILSPQRISSSSRVSHYTVMSICNAMSAGWPQGSKHKVNEWI